MTSTTLDAGLLRRTMRFNAAFSILTALECLFFAQPVANLMGLGRAGSLPVALLGVLLLGFAAFLLTTWSSLVKTERTVLMCGTLAIILDVTWVLGSLGVLTMDLLPLSLPGKWIVAIAAVFVLDFAIFQTLGLRRLRTSIAVLA